MAPQNMRGKRRLRLFPVVSVPITILCFVTILVCMAGVITSTVIFGRSQVRLADKLDEASTLVADAVAYQGQLNLDPESVDLLDKIRALNSQQIDQILKIQEIQKLSSSSDIMGLLYAVLTTIMLVIGVYFVRNIQEHHDKIMEEGEKEIERQRFDILMERSSLQLDYMGITLEIMHQDIQANKRLIDDYVPRIREILASIKKQINIYAGQETDSVAQVSETIDWFAQRIESIEKDKGGITKRTENELKKKWLDVQDAITKKFPNSV